LRLLFLDRLLIGHYGIDKIDLDFLPFTSGDITGTTLGTDVRPWLVDLTDINAAGIGLAAVGGLFAFVVIFFDQNITVRLVNASEHKLKKGYGYDMDMMALCLCTVLLSLCGCPWLVSASKLPRHVVTLDHYIPLQLPDNMLLTSHWFLCSTAVPSLNHCRSLCFFGNEGGNDKQEDEEKRIEEQSMKVRVAVCELSFAMIKFAVSRGNGTTLN
jgi:hypothetical protein